MYPEDWQKGDTVFYGTTVNFIIKELNFCKIEKEGQLEIDHVIEEPKETCQESAESICVYIRYSFQSI